MSCAPGEAYQSGWSHEAIKLQGLPNCQGGAHEAFAQPDTVRAGLSLGNARAGVRRK